MDWPGHDVAPRQPLFSRAVPMLLLQDGSAGLGERCAVLVVTISSLARPRALRLQLTSEAELLLLHQLTVGEDDFATLKAEQGIVVDFAGFPAKLASLLERCVAGGPFQATLACTGVRSVLRIVETNDFRQLAHISLVFQAGSDAAVKELLAGRLQEARQALAETAAALAHTRAERDSAKAGFEATGSELAEARTRHEAQLRQAAGEAAARMTAAGEEHDRQLAAAAASGRQKEAAAAEQAEALRAEARALEGGRAALAAQLHATAQTLAAAQADRQRLEAELAAARAATARTEAEAAERSATVADLRGSLRALESQAGAQAAQLEQQGRQLQAAQLEAQGGREQAREAQAHAAATSQRFSVAAAEGQQARRLVERLTEDLRMVREKLRRNQAVIERQEAEIEAGHAAAQTAGANAQKAGAALGELQAEAARLKGETGGLQRKLQECSQQLQSSEQMIRWLNDQLNAAHGAAAAGASGQPPQSRPAPAMERSAAGRENQQPAPQGQGVPRLKSSVGRQIVASHCGPTGA